ncbi:MAG: glycosyltransferase family 2 protein [Bacteroidales bacterium]|nr:glycosyltransferase family 2 protein [Bacteroidales bacterium]
MKKLAIIIPAYNEQDSIEKVVNSLNNLENIGQFVIQPIVVNDCSTDNTAQIIEDLDCVKLNLPCNLGIGGAVQTGLIYARDNDFDYAMQMDGDGQHPANQIHLFIEKAMKKDAPDVIIGSRYINKIGFQSSFMRRLGIRFLGFVIKCLTGLKITDSTSGFRMLNKKALNLVAENYPDEYPEPESILLYKKANLKIEEIGVEMKERIGGKSSINELASIYYMIKVSLALLFTNFTKNIKNG